MAATGATAPRRRTTPRLLAADRRVDEVGVRLGRAFREARIAAGLRQSEVAVEARLSQSAVSRLERGLVATVDLRVIAHVGAAVGLRLAAFFEAAPGASLPRDHEHLKRQELLIRLGAAGGWRAVAEAAIDPDAPRSRSIDVLLRRGDEVVVAEIWDLLDDVGAAFRSLADKVAAIRRSHPGSTVAGVLVLRGTRRNRELVARLQGLFRSRFAGSGAAVIGALSSGDRPLPATDALLWTDVAGTRLVASRLGTPRLSGAGLGTPRLSGAGLGTPRLSGAGLGTPRLSGAGLGTPRLGTSRPSPGRPTTLSS